MIKTVITGTGRCGTVYFARLLTSLGLPCGHEAIFTPLGWPEAVRRLDSSQVVSSAVSGMDTMPIQADASYMAAPFLHRLDGQVVHLVRNPLQVINSFVVGFCYFLSGNLDGKTKEWRYEYPPGADPDFRYHRFIYQHLPMLQEPMPAAVRAAWYYVWWNKMIEDRCSHYFRHRIEDDVNPVLTYLGLSAQPGMYANRMANKVEYVCRYDLDSLGSARDAVMAIASEYGYCLDASKALLI